MAKGGTYRVFFHRGKDLSIKTRVEKGTAEIYGSSLTVRSAAGDFTVPLDREAKASMILLYGLARVVVLDRNGKRTYMGVIRLMVGQFVIGNRLGTGRLFKDLSNLTAH